MNVFAVAINDSVDTINLFTAAINVFSTNIGNKTHRKKESGK
jgi:hypothetical protein